MAASNRLRLARSHGMSRALKEYLSVAGPSGWTSSGHCFRYGAPGGSSDAISTWCLPHTGVVHNCFTTSMGPPLAGFTEFMIWRIFTIALWGWKSPPAELENVYHLRGLPIGLVDVVAYSIVI